MKRYAVVFEKAESNWSAYVPDLPGCITTGKTLDETKQNIREAVELHLEAMREVGEPIPEPSSNFKPLPEVRPRGVTDKGAVAYRFSPACRLSTMVSGGGPLSSPAGPFTMKRCPSAVGWR